MGEPVHVLLVEDDDIDVMTVKRAFTRLKLANPLHVARDGFEALAMLRGEEGHEPLPRPYVVLLDLNMPRMSGTEFLQQLRRDPQHGSAVVFVLTTSGQQADRVSAYALNVAGYIVKETVGDDFTNVVSMLQHYWQVVELP